MRRRGQRPPTGRCLALIGLLLLGGCATAGQGPSRVDPVGPPFVRADVVESHAEQLDEEIAERPAGSQEEFAASQYVLGHLQRAGYVVALEAVPVGNLVQSNNLHALPPNGRDASLILATPYDADERYRGGIAVAVFLEVARALYAAEPDHRVEFVALSAETTADRLGSRRLAQQLRDASAAPRIVSIVAGDRSEVRAAGGDAASVIELAHDEEVFASVGSARDLLGGEDVFAAAGFDHVVISVGDASHAGVVLDYLLAASD